MLFRSDAEAEFDAVEIDESAKPARGDVKRPKLFGDWWRENVLSTGAPYLIKGWYDFGSMVVTYGESNSGKTNVVLNQAFAIASGRPWHNAKVRQGLVVYVAAEGGRGLRKRIAAYHKRFGVADIPFVTVPCPVDLLRPNGDTKALIELVKGFEAECGQRCVMIVLDTLSRVLAGGNENAPDDMGALVLHCDKIRAATGATVHLIHHSGKNQAAGARGHSSLRAATDTEIEIRPGEIEGTKQRDMEKASSLSFRLEDVTLGVDDDGDTIHSVVAVVEDVNEFEVKISPAAEALFRVLVDLSDKRDNPDIGLSWREWFEAAKGPENDSDSGQKRRGVSRSNLVELRKVLSESGKVRLNEQNQWVVCGVSECRSGVGT